MVTSPSGSVRKTRAGKRGPRRRRRSAQWAHIACGRTPTLNFAPAGKSERLVAHGAASMSTNGSCRVRLPPRLRFSVAGNQIDRRIADQRSDEFVAAARYRASAACRPARCALPAARRRAAHAERLDLVGRGIDDRGVAQLAMQTLEFGARVVAQLGVEVGQRLVEQQQLAAGGSARGRSRSAAARRRTACRACAPARAKAAASRRSRRRGVLISFAPTRASRSG